MRTRTGNSLQYSFSDPKLSSMAFVLREVLRDIEEDEEEKQGFTKEEEESVKKRLKVLGYLD